MTVGGATARWQPGDRPVRHPRTAFRDHPGAAVAVQSDGGEIHVLNDLAGWIFGRVDGRRTVRDLENALVGEYDVDHRRAACDLAALLDDLAGLRLLSPLPEWELRGVGEIGRRLVDAETVVGLDTPLSRLREEQWNRAVPQSAQLELTYACNLDCAYCYNVVDHGQRELSTVEMVEVFRKIAEAGVLYLTLTGGEPLARRDFFTLGHAARDMGFGLRIYTNAHAIDPARADKMASITPVEVETSIHGARAETHESQTAVPGSFRRLLTAVRLLRERDIKVNLKCAITRLNENEVREVHALGAELDCRVIFDTVIMPRDDGDREPLSLAASEEFLARYWSSEMDDLRPDPRVEPRDNSRIAAVCGTGRSSFTMDPYGNVLPCVVWRRPLGNLRTAASLREIWNEENAPLKEVRDTAIEMTRVLRDQPDGVFAPYCLGLAEKQTGDATAGYRQVEINARLRHGAFHARGGRARDAACCAD